MKKFLLSSALIMLVTGAFAQQCPIGFKRNNGNGGGFAGNITFDFASPVSAQLYVSTIVEVGSNPERSAVMLGIDDADSRHSGDCEERSVFQLTRFEGEIR